MKDIRDPTHHTPSYWPASGRPTEPFRIGFPPTSALKISPVPDAFYTDIVHPHLLSLVPGDGDSFDDFVKALGIDEFLYWAYGVPLREWTGIAERYSADRSLDQNAVAAAWKSATTVMAVGHQQATLRQAFEAFFPKDTNEQPTAQDAAATVAALGWEKQIYQIEIDLHPSGIIVERPKNLWVRAWLELLDGHEQRRLPKVCPHCGTTFIPTRRNRRYCRTTCRQRANEKRRAKRTEYQREAARKRRARQRS